MLAHGRVITKVCGGNVKIAPPECRERAGMSDEDFAEGFWIVDCSLRLVWLCVLQPPVDPAAVPLQ